MWWNNFYTWSDNTYAFINNHFYNTWEFIPWSTWTIFINNLVENTSEVDNTWRWNSINNIFTGGFIDTKDPDNLKRNFSSIDTVEWWLGWSYTRTFRAEDWTSNDVYFGNINYTDKSLYEEYTWETLPDTYNPVYIRFNY